MSANDRLLLASMILNAAVATSGTSLLASVVCFAFFLGATIVFVKRAPSSTS